jgi:tetratricopeptide (TPR) repeat protein
MTKLTVNLSQVLSSAISAYKAGKLAETEQICQRIIHCKPDLFAALHLLAVVQSRLGKKDTALASYDRALMLRPDSAEALSNRGNTLKELKRFEEALASYDRALMLRPDLAEALYNRGNTLRELKWFEEALAGYDRALKVRPDYAGVHNNRGLILHELKRFQEALASYDRALKVQPNYAEVHNNRGFTLHALKRFGEALASYDRALTMRPDFAEAHSNRGLTLHELKRFEAALASYDRALALRPDYAEALSNRGVTLHEIKRFEEALASYDRAVSLRPDYATALASRGLTLQGLMRLEEALASYDRALAIRPDYPEAHNNRGVTLHELERFEEALASYDGALAVRPDYAEALSNRGNTLKELRRFDDALASYEHALTVRPDYAETHYNLGITLMEVGRLSAASAALEQAIELAPFKVKYRRALGEVTRFVTGDTHLSALEKLAKEDTTLSIDDRIDLHFALAKAYEDLDRHAEAFREWRDGNAIKRRQITYNEANMLGMLNRTRAVFTAELIRARQNVGNPSSVPVFIVGMMRSGSTLVEQILASHPQVFGGGELKHFGAAVKRIPTTPGGSVTFPELVLGMTGDDYTNLGTRYLAETERSAPGATHVTDKMLENFIFAGLIHLALPNAPIIHTVRDPVDTCLSCFSKLFAEGQNHTYDLAELGRYYRHYQALMKHWQRVLPPGRILDVCYENLVADLEGQARRVIAHCGLEWDPRCLTFHQTHRSVLTASAAQVRRPIYSNAVGRWRVHEEALRALLAELNIASDGESTR